MNRLKLIASTYFLPVITVLIVGFTHDNSTDSGMQLCKQSYALCTSALCVPQPGDPTTAICFCDVEEGSSMSTVPCDTLRPTVDANGIRTIYSTYSFKQFLQGKMAMKCPSGTPWTWCLNKRCTVDPNNSKKAICTCDVVRTGEWMTLGGNCDTSTCTNGYWSGATLKGNETGNAFMTKALELKESPVKWCPISS